MELGDEKYTIFKDRSQLCPKKKRKITPYDKEEEERLEKLLFEGSKGLVKSLPNKETEVESTNDAELEDEENRLKPAWFDDDDEVAVGEALDYQGRKLPRGGINTRDNLYSNLLKHKFTELVGSTAWASLDKPNYNSDSDDDALQTCGFIEKSEKLHLPSKTIEFKTLLNLNKETGNEGPEINCVEFHGKSSVALVAGKSGIASLFAVDGKQNSKLHNVEFEKFPIICAKFSKDGNEAILGSCRKHIYSYDLLAGKAIRVTLPGDLTQCKNFVISPDGRLLAVAGRWGQVHVLSSTSKECFYVLKLEGEVTSLSFSPNGNYLYGHSDHGEVTVWDLNMRRVKHKWSDEGCLTGTSIDVSESNQFLATGSGEGVVNIYDIDKIWNTSNPKPRKSVMNLTTSISGVKFNPTSEILSFYSKELDNAIRLLHVGKNTTFENFPPHFSKMGNIKTVNFSPGSSYFAVGNTKSTVFLFSLKHYKSY